MTRLPGDKCECESMWRSGKMIVRLPNGQVVKMHEINCEEMERKYGPFEDPPELALVEFIKKRSNNGFNN